MDASTTESHVRTTDRSGAPLGTFCAASCASSSPLRITVLAGGPSAERAVSLESGRAVHAALSRLGHRCALRDVVPDDLSALEEPTDFVFIALHGAFGEDGTIQGELDRRGICYSGSGAAASRLAMDKAAAKHRFAEVGVPTPPYEVVDASRRAGLATRFGIPAVVKPVDSGSSVDTVIVRSAERLEPEAARLVGQYGRALVERYIRGPELTVGIVGDTALPVCQIIPAGEFYDYHAKYVADDTEYRFDIDLPETLLQRVRELSLRAHRALDCDVFSRVDWMVDAETREPYCLEINTIPGFTSHSLLPKAAARIGVSFDALCGRIVRLSTAKSAGAVGTARSAVR
jgi:D-alanine-D-alanine ligase